MKTKTTFFKASLSIILLVIFSSIIFSSCTKEPIDVDITIQHTIEINTFGMPNGIGLISDNNDTVTIVLEPITEITAHSGRASGNVTLIGESSGFGSMGYGIYWDTMQNPPLSSNNCVLKNFSEDFSFLMYNLQPSTKYYVGLFLTQTNENGAVTTSTAITYYRDFTTLDE